MKYLYAAAIITIVINPALSQDCELPAASDWNSNTISNEFQGSVAFGLTKTGDAFVAEMVTGRIKHYKQSDGSVADLGKVDDELYVDEGGVIENGLLGVTPDPDFETNNWIYTLYSRQMSNNNTTDCRRDVVYDHKVFLVRFTVENDALTNPKDLMSFQRWSTSHAAGGLTFDHWGNLWITTGDDSNPFSDNGRYGPRGAQGACSGRPVEEVAGVDAQSSSGNTNDLRGKSLRITPIPFPDSESPPEGPGATYEIPPGNLYDEALDTEDKTRPEIYSMGHRNPYRARVDSITGWLMIGEVGPDGGQDNNQGTRGHDEFNLVKEPGNYGWPYANADNLAYTVMSDKEGSDVTVGEQYDLENLTNTSPLNTGLINLPPATPPLAWYTEDGNQQGEHMDFFGGGGESAIGGPRYWYNGVGDEGRMPAYFQGKFIVADWVRARIWVLDVDEGGNLLKVEALRPDNSGSAMQEPFSPIDLAMGPGGVLYVLYTGGLGYGGWSSGGSIVRYEFEGTHYTAASCGDKIIQDPVVNVPEQAAKEFTQSQTVMFHYNSSNHRVAVPENAETISIFDVNGKKVFTGKNIGNQKSVSVPQKLVQGIYFAKFSLVK